MHPDFWSKWAQTLQQRNLTGIAISFLEGSAPLRLILSQVLQGISPLIGQSQNEVWQSFTQMLEDPSECRAFTAFLREEENLD